MIRGACLALASSALAAACTRAPRAYDVAEANVPGTGSVASISISGRAPDGTLWTYSAHLPDASLAADWHGALAKIPGEYWKRSADTSNYDWNDDGVADYLFACEVSRTVSVWDGACIAVAGEVDGVSVTDDRDGDACMDLWIRRGTQFSQLSARTGMLTPSER